MAAYETLPTPPERHAPPIRRSPEEWHGRALDGSGLYQFFEAAYPGYPVLRLFGDEAKPLPVWAEAAPRERWTDVEAPLGTLDLSQPPPDVRRWDSASSRKPAWRRGVRKETAEPATGHPPPQARMPTASATINQMN